MAKTVSSFSTPDTVLQCNTLHPHRGLEVRQRGLDLPTLAVQFGEVGHTVDVRVEERGHQSDLAGSEAWAAECGRAPLGSLRSLAGPPTLPG